ncbi:MAG TPA: S53 family peptidase [Acidimicrobiales bacterium]|nr:S53 family peptidase [Acidimicrobiales bacterium]
MPRPSPRRLALLAALPALAVGTAPIAAAGASAAPAPAPTEVLTTQVVHGLSSATRTGDVDPAKVMTVDLLLTPSGSGFEGMTAAQLEAHLYTPGDPLYHHFLTTDQYAAAYGAPAGSAAQAAAFGTAHGLHLVSIDAMHDAVVLSGTAAQVEATFKTGLATYATRNRTFFANTTAPTVPAGIGVAGVLGLDDATKFTTASGATPRTAQQICAAACVGATTPQDMWVAYDQPTGDPKSPGTTDFGQGQQLAVIGEGETATVINDLGKFEDEFGLPHIPVTVDHVNGPAANYSDSSGDEEWDIDMQASTGMAPDASKLTLYFGSALDDTSLVNAIDAWTNQPDGALQANMSIDGCEGVAPASPASPVSGTPYTTLDPLSEDLTFQNGFDTALQEAVDTGRTLFNSSGDVGSGCPYLPADTNGVAVQPGVPGYPASSPHVVSVGGTVLYGTPGATTNASSGDTPITGRALEYAWTFSGGGFSQAYPQPAYQADSGLIAAAPPCVTNPADGNTYVQDGQTPPAACRAVPDIAAQSGDVATNGYDIVASGADTEGGGTSLASPLSMGMWARVQAADAADTLNGAYVGHGFADYTLYRAAAAKSSPGAYDPNGDFFDVGDVTNGQTIVNNNGLYTTGPGYDEVTGLGVMDVGKLLVDVDGGNTTPTSSAVPPATGGTATGGTTTGGSTGSTASPSTAACYPLFTDAAGDDDFTAGGTASGNKGANPQLDLLQGDLHTVQLDANHKPVTSGGTDYLEATLTLKDLSTAPPSANGAPLYGVTANQYYLLWTVGSTTYFASAQVDPTVSATGTPSVTYGNGTLTKVGTSTQYTNAAGTGDFGDFNPGPDGTIDIYVPLSAANVGATTTGTALASPYGTTFVEIGNPNVGGSLQQVDTGGPGYDYTLGEVCSANGKPGSDADPGLAAGTPPPSTPEAPFVVALPLVGAYAAYRVRRRRQGATA